MTKLVWHDIIFVQDVTHAPHIIIEGIAFTINQWNACFFFTYRLSNDTKGIFPK